MAVYATLLNGLKKGATTLSITTFSMTTLSMTTLTISDSQHNNSLQLRWASHLISYNAECSNAKS
jgi:hypothetical protein